MAKGNWFFFPVFVCLLFKAENKVFRRICFALKTDGYNIHKHNGIHFIFLNFFEVLKTEAKVVEKFIFFNNEN